MRNEIYELVILCNVRTFVPSGVTSQLSMRNMKNKTLKGSYLAKNIQKNDRKISDFLRKYEPSMTKRSHFSHSIKIFSIDLL